MPHADTSDAEPAAGRRPKAIILLSGGLDSTLAVQLMLDQGVEVVALNFVSPFCTCSPRREGGCHLASAVAQKMGVKIRVMSKGADYMKVVEHPKHGYGSGLNPCLDCRIYMLRKSVEVMAEENAQFMVTGEVLGQRPMSQHRKALDLVEKESGLKGLILRPLSAQWLEPTIPEIRGWVDRSRLLAIQGRSRHDQLALAREKNIELYGCPSGGCLLTDGVIAGRLKDLFRYCPDYDMKDVTAVTVGRHLRLHPALKIIMGRNKEENERLMRMAAGWPRAELVDIPGPLMLLRGAMRDGDREQLGRLLLYYTPKAAAGKIAARLTRGEKVETWTASARATKVEVDALTI